MKLALIRSVLRDFKTPAVTADDVKFGAAFAWSSAKMLRDGLRAYMASAQIVLQISFLDRSKLAGLRPFER